MKLKKTKQNKHVQIPPLICDLQKQNKEKKKRNRQMSRNTTTKP